MGPTTAALLRYFLADQAFIEAKHKLDAATKNVRIQESKVAQLKAEHDAAHTAAVTAEAKAREVEGDMKDREAHIEKLRDRQTNATNQKEYQALIVDINTQKLDKTKLEEQTLKHMDEAETAKKTAAELKVRFDAESAKYKQMAGEINDRVKELTNQVEALRGPRDEAGALLPPPAMASYNRASDRYEGEALACLEKPNPRDQEYLCAGCNTYLVADIYNRLRSPKDDIVTCPSCQRVLFIPEELTPELALSKKAERGDKKPPKPPKVKKEPKAPGEKKPRAPRTKKEPIIAAGEPGSVAAARAAGAASATGRGPKDTRKASEPPLPSTADGVSNTADDAEQASEQGDDQSVAASASGEESSN